MSKGNQADFWSGVMFAAAGAFFVVFAREYDFGTAQRMGPAYFPTVLGVLLVLLGIAIAVKGRLEDDGSGTVEPFHWKPLLFVLGAVVVYALLLRPAGLIVAIFALVGISALGSHEFRWKEVVALSIGMAVLVYGVFIWGLKLVIPVLPAFLAD